MQIRASTPDLREMLERHLQSELATLLSKHPIATILGTLYPFEPHWLGSKFDRRWQGDSARASWRYVFPVRASIA